MAPCGVTLHTDVADDIEFNKLQWCVIIVYRSLWFYTTKTFHENKWKIKCIRKLIKVYLQRVLTQCKIWSRLAAESVFLFVFSIQFINCINSIVLYNNIILYCSARHSSQIETRIVNILSTRRTIIRRWLQVNSIFNCTVRGNFQCTFFILFFIIR